jgi:TRAPP trafficking subunit Trs65
MNLLQYFANDPALAKSNPRLSASRLTKQAPTVPAEQLVRPIRNGPRRLFRAAPAFLWRVRFSSFPALTEKDSILACFDLETTQFAGSDLMIDSISLRLSSGAAQPIHVELPRLCRPGEQLTVIYKLLPAAASEMFVDDASQQRTLTITASATVLVSKECTPKVKIKWKTALEVPKSRPNSRSGLSPLGMQLGNLQYRELPTTPGPDTLIMADQFAGIEPTSTISNGVSLTISGSKDVYVGEVFRWEVFIVNRSDKIHRFAIFALPKRRVGDQNSTVQRPSQSDIGSFGSEPKDLARPILDDNVIYSFQKSEMMDPTELICLSPDVRIG